MLQGPLSRPPQHEGCWEMTTKLPFHLRSALEQARLLRARKISARELLDLCWAQVEKHNKALNAVIISDMERARKAAAATDRRLKAGRPKGVFDGVPMTSHNANEKNSFSPAVIAASFP